MSADRELLSPSAHCARRFAALAFSLIALLGNGPAESPVLARVAAVQARYDGIADLRAGFVQTSYTAALGRETVSKGSLTMKRPGLFRWEYSTPEERVIVLDAETLRIYSPVDEQLQVIALAQGTVSPTALSFLLGNGELRELFEAEAIDDPERPELGLRLRPREESSFEFIELWVARETHQLRESVLVDLFKNRTSVRFVEIVENVGIEESAFSIDVPEGTEVIDLR